MPIYKGNTKIVRLYKGSAEIVKRYKGNDLIYSALPIGYQRVEYIESSGTQYINSGWKPDSSIKKFKVIANAQVLVAQQYSFIWNIGNTFGTGTYIGYGNSISYNNFCLFLNGVRAFQSLVASDLNKHIFGLEINGDDVKTIIDNSENLDTYSVWSSWLTWYNNYLELFGLQSDMTRTYCKIFSCQVYENDVLVRDFVPCYRKSDNVIGLFDIVNQVFYTNAGTGTFLKGADI